MSKKQESKKQVVAASSKDIADPKLNFDLADYQPTDETIDDIAFPRIIPMNPTSRMVNEGQAVFGTLVDQSNGAVLATADKPLAIVPVYIQKTYMVSKKVGAKFEFVRVEPFDVAGRPYEYDALDGDRYKNELCYNVYCLLEGDIDIPYMLTFKGMSVRSGRQIWTLMFRRNLVAGIPPFGRIIHVTPRKDKNPQGVYVVLDVKAGEKINGPILRTADEWFMTLRRSEKHLVDKTNSSEVSDDVVDHVEC